MKNFRFHEDVEVEIPDQGFCLLSGVSGRGKTTILNAITYAFYSHIRAPYTHDTTTCRVDLEYKKDGRTINISRSSHPNTLKVTYKKEKYEGDAAQGVIDQILGINYDVYMASSYIVQQTHKSVLFMTPGQQLEFVEKLTFNTDDHTQCKQRFKAYTKECQSQVVKREEKITILQSQWQKAQDCIKHYDDIRGGAPDLGDIDPDQVKTEVQSIKKSIDSLQKVDANLSKTLEELQEEEDTKKVLVEKKKRLETELSQWKKMREDIGSVKLDDEVDNLEKKLQKSKRWLEHTRAYESYFDSLSSVDRMEEEHFKELKLQVKEAKKKIPDEKKINILKKSYEIAKNQIDEQSQGAEENMKNKIKREEAVETVKRIFKEVKKLYDTQVKKPSGLLEYLQKEKEEAKEEHAKENKSIEDNNKLLLQRESMKKVYQCPKCSSKLAVFDESLMFPKELPKIGNVDKVKKSIDDSTKMVNTLFGELVQLDIWLKDLGEAIPSYKLKVGDGDCPAREETEKLERELKSIEEAQTVVQNLLDQIKSRNIPSSIRKIRDEIEAKKKFPENFKPRSNMKDLQEEIEKLASEIESSKRSKGDHASMSREIHSRQEKLKKISKRLGHDRKVGTLDGDKSNVDTVESITTRLTENRKKVMTSAKRLSELQEKLEIISSYEVYQKDVSRVKDSKRDLKQAEFDLKLASKNLEAAHGLEQTVKEAEILAMEKTLTNINISSASYLEEMFSEDPICIRLENHKTDKSKSKGSKLQMNTNVQYRGKRYNSVDELSGGEKQRCNLAFLLAVNSMVNSPFLFLDECLNNLDNNTNMDTLTYLKGVADKKLVLVISHEAIEGSFDKIIEL
jgi:DNA repair exonuclease SbcCD ATPase subunit